MKNGGEIDAFSRRHRVLYWRPGARKRIKRGYNKRTRKRAASKTFEDIMEMVLAERAGAWEELANQ